MSITASEGVSATLVQPRVYRGPTTPTIGSIGDLWEDTSGGTPVLKQCTSTSPLIWDAVSSGSGVTDHGLLTGLADDDHTQYHTDARGDARYSLLGHTHSGLAPTGGASGYVLKKNSITDYDYSWQVDSTGGGGSATLTEVEVDLATTKPRDSGSFTISSSGLTTGKMVSIQKSNGPYTGKGTLADEAEMDVIQVTGKVTDSTTIQCYWSSSTLVKGNHKFHYLVGA